MNCRPQGIVTFNNFHSAVQPKSFNFCLYSNSSPKDVKYYSTITSLYDFRRGDDQVLAGNVGYNIVIDGISYFVNMSVTEGVRITSANDRSVVINTTSLSRDINNRTGKVFQSLLYSVDKYQSDGRILRTYYMGTSDGVNTISFGDQLRLPQEYSNTFYFQAVDGFSAPQFNVVTSNYPGRENQSSSDDDSIIPNWLQIFLIILVVLLFILMIVFLVMYIKCRNDTKKVVVKEVSDSNGNKTRSETSFLEHLVTTS